MILFTLIVYVAIYLKKRLTKDERLLEDEEGGTGKSSMSHSIEIEKDYQLHPNHHGQDRGGPPHQNSNQHH